MGTRSTTGGNTIRLRALFKDDLNNETEANDVFIHIFEPDKDSTDLTEATVVSGVAEYLGEGIYEYEYSVPDTGPEGTWIDVWEGELNGQGLLATLEFNVETSGIIESFESQLFTNDLVQVTIESGIESTDGFNLEETFESEFLVTTSPSYTNIRKVRLEVGAYVKDLPDLVLQMAILEASLEADALNFVSKITNQKLFNHARREYVTCSASRDLLSNTGNLLLKTKTLADLHVEYDVSGVRKASDKLEACMEKWEPQLIAGGGLRSSQQPKYVVKGELDPDRPISARQWESTDNRSGSNQVPAANDRLRRTDQRRHKRTYSHRKKWW